MKSAQFIQTTACTPRGVCLILWVEYPQFFAIHISLCTNDSYPVLKSGNVLFSEASEASGADSLMSSRYIYVTGFAKRDLIAQNKKIELLVPRDSSILEH